jgi:hypothetical protein
MALFTLTPACKAASEDSPKERDEPAEARRASDASEPPQPSEGCAQRERENQEWLEEWQTCESDEDCELVRLAARCVAPFACPVGLNVHVDRTQLELDALERAATYSRDCGCAEIACAPRRSARAVCDQRAKRCRPVR